MEYYKQNRKKQSLRRRFEAKMLIIEIKNRPCGDCGGKFQHYQMDLIKNNKGVKISKLLIKSKDSIIKELIDCELLCANCSRKRFWILQREKRMGES